MSPSPRSGDPGRGLIGRLTAVTWLEGINLLGGGPFFCVWFRGRWWEVHPRYMLGDISRRVMEVCACTRVGVCTRVGMCACVCVCVGVHIQAASDRQQHRHPALCPCLFPPCSPHHRICSPPVPALPAPPAGTGAGVSFPPVSMQLAPQLPNPPALAGHWPPLLPCSGLSGRQKGAVGPTCRMTDRPLRLETCPPSGSSLGLGLA